MYEPKKRTIHALRYRDRVVQHCLCDEVLEPLFEKRLIYDNSACRKGKGTLFAVNRLSLFLRKFYRIHGNSGYFLKCDVRKFFDSIGHDQLKAILRRIIQDRSIYALCEMIIDSYETSLGKGLPLGNQSSQWFALLYLDGLDRLCKERLRLKYYTRYMDDIVIVHEDKNYLHECVHQMREFAQFERGLTFNEKTQIFPLKNGVEYLGFRFALSDSGAVVRRVKTSSKLRYKRRLRRYQALYREGWIEMSDIRQSLAGFHGHLKHGDTYWLRRRALGKFALSRTGIDK
ncbi:MAG: reverse transcriptase/maturase family protein [Oscillospiraceae bacterium]|nr:reverse transcriptase/maturase family protein [Oscillospiraceae bacterium]